MLEHVAELVGLDDLEVDLHARVREHARAGVARRLHGLDQRQLGQRGRQRGGILGGGDDVEVLDGVGLAAQRAGHLDALGGRVRAQRADDLLGDVLRAREQDARRRAALRRLGERLEQRLLDLRAEAAQPADLLLLGGGAQRVERVDRRARRRAAARAWARSPAGASPRSARSGTSRAGAWRSGCRPSRRARGSSPRASCRSPLISVTRPSRASRGDRHRGLAHGLGRGAVGDHAVGDGAVELVEVPELVEGGGDLCVREVGHRTGSSVRRSVPGPVWLILPTYDEAARSRRRRRGAGGARRRGPPHPRGRRRLARRHRRARRAARRRGAAPPGEARARERLRRRLRPRARAPARSSSASSTPTARTTRPRCPACSPLARGSRGPRARLALRAGRRGRGLAPGAARGLARRLPATRAPSCACRCATSPAA